MRFRTSAPAIIGAGSAVLVLAVGLVLSDAGPSTVVEAAGDAVLVPESPASASERESRAPWEPPALPREEELAEMDYQEYIETLQTQIDPRGPEESGGNTVVYNLDGGADIRFGQSGWDSSSYPRNPPVLAPDGFTLYRAEDRSAHPEDMGRNWAYWSAEKGEQRATCLQTLQRLQVAGFEILAGGDCQNIAADLAAAYESELYILNGHNRDGDFVEVNIRANGGPCLTTEGGQCPQWTLYLRQN